MKVLAILKVMKFFTHGAIIDGCHNISSFLSHQRYTLILEPLLVYTSAMIPDYELFSPPPPDMSQYEYDRAILRGYAMPAHLLFKGAKWLLNHVYEATVDPPQRVPPQHRWKV